MTSKSSFSDLVKNKIKRSLWQLVAFSFLFALYFPVQSLMYVGQRMDGSEIFSEQQLNTAKRYIYNDLMSQIDSVALILLLTLIAAVCAYAQFSYLHDRKQTNFYHSLPIKRSVLFFINVITCIISVALPYLVMSLLSAGIVTAYSGYPGCISQTLLEFFINLGFFLLIFMTAVLAMMLTGNAKVGVMGMIALFVWGPYCVYMWEGLYAQYFDTYYRLWENTSAIAKYTSPVVWAFGDGVTSDLQRGILAYIATLVLYALNFWVYRVRKSEKASSSMIFKWSEVVIEFVVAVPAALGIMAIVAGIMNNSPVWAGFAVVIAAIVVCGILEIIFKLDFKKFFARRLEMLICVLVSVLGFAFFNFDLSGYDLFIPDISNVASIGIQTYGLEDIYGNEGTIHLETTDGTESPSLIYTYLSAEDVADRMHIAENAGAVNETLRKISIIRDEHQDTSADSVSPYYNGMYRVLAAWHLNNGTTVYREYTIDLSMVSDELSELYDDEEFKEGTYPVLAWSEDEVSDLQEVGYQDVFGVHTLTFAGMNEEEKKTAIAELYNTYTEELKALTLEDRSTHSPVTTLQFRNSYFVQMYETILSSVHYSYNDLDYYGHYPVYSSFTRTLELMERYGADINSGLNADDVDRIVISDLGTYDSYTQDVATEYAANTTAKPDLEVTDKTQIQEILDATIYNVSCSNSLRARWDSLDCMVNLEREFQVDAYSNGADTAVDDSTSSSYSSGSMPSTIYFYFAADNIPDFVREYFELTDEELSIATNSLGWHVD